VSEVRVRLNIRASYQGIASAMLHVLEIKRPFRGKASREKSREKYMAIARIGKMLATLAVLAAAFLVVSASAESKARIVRLSQVQGTVQIDRAAGDGFDKAFINLPVIEGSKLKTGKDGRAEVEFEDGSALRLAPDSEVDFTRLALGDDGRKLSAVQLVSGTVYANLHPKKSGNKAGDPFQLNFANESVTVAEAAHFRVELDGAGKATVAVFKGKLSATSPAGQFEVAEKHSATIDLTKDDLAKNDSARKGAFVIAKNFEAEPSDAWDRQQTDYHDRYASAGGSSISSPYGYGMSDLNYYGSFMNVAGYGNVWQPYFLGADWSPFQDGGWAFYPGAGYMWVSGYPWGWMPYNYGNWAFAPGFGWVWQPGYYNPWYGIPQVVNPPVRTKVPTPPVRGHQTVMVGLGLAANPAAGAPRRLTINPGSAGFGVPRGSVRHLDRVAKTMERTSRPVVVATAPPVSTTATPTGFGTSPSSPSPSMRGGTSTGMAPMGSPHRSSAPPSRPH
jgi:ferric-dicitrate binding protein FerR (iron transport regulator)